MTQIVLVRPNYKSHLITPPLGLGYLSSFLKKQGFSVRIIDGLNLGLSNEQAADQCRAADLVGINCLSYYYPEVIDLAKRLKALGKRVVIGGPHPTALPELTLQETGADYIIVGEGEQSFLELVQGLPANLPPGKFIKSELIPNLDDLPFPDWEQLDPRTYKKAPHGGLIKSFPVAPIMTSRGCPYECTFCSSGCMWGRKIRFRSPANVVAEIELLIQKYGVKEIHFEDDNLTMRRGHIERICELILQKGLKFNWATPNGVRADALDLDLLKLMKKSGCYMLAFGIESANQGILDEAKKRIDLARVEAAIKLARQAGIVTQGFFIFGLPGETAATASQTINFAKRTKLDRAQFLVLDLLPGTELWERYKDKNNLNWQYDSYHEPVWEPAGLTKKQIQQILKNAYLSFYLRPARLAYILRHLRLSQVPFIIDRLKEFIIKPRHANNK